MQQQIGTVDGADVPQGAEQLPLPRGVDAGVGQKLRQVRVRSSTTASGVSAAATTTSRRTPSNSPSTVRRLKVQSGSRVSNIRVTYAAGFAVSAGWRKSSPSAFRLCGHPRRRSRL